MAETPKREEILKTVAHHALTDVLYDSLANFAKTESGAAFKVRVEYYANKYGPLKITDSEIAFMVKAICDANVADIEIEAKIKFLKEISK